MFKGKGLIVINNINMAKLRTSMKCLQVKYQNENLADVKHLNFISWIIWRRYLDYFSDDSNHPCIGTCLFLGYTAPPLWTAVFCKPKNDRINTTPLVLQTFLHTLQTRAPGSWSTWRGTPCLSPVALDHSDWFRLHSRHIGDRIVWNN